ncbi:Mth938-like domain-containing protein [Pelagibius sp. CAU 1746]|uniref:Mth938-like domain-containing protein n=1 Tax=Pelagibius sp. CAU 1746 TaxID=3140370 RepID=UPI00325C1B17
MDVTPLIPQGRQIIESYGGGGFTVTGEAYRGSILVLPDWTGAWPLGGIDELNLESLEPVLTAEPPVEVLLLGCGAAMAFIEPELREAARARGVALEPMDTGAACRTYNVLVAEDRRVAAALIAVD